MQLYGYDLLLGSIAALYVFLVPYTKVEESFNVQAMHDILYHRHQIEKYDHLEFPGVVPRTFIGALIISILASPIVLTMKIMHLEKVHSLVAVRLVLGCLVLSALRFFRIEIRKKFGSQVEALFVILTSLQFHMLFYCTRPLPNILAFCLVALAYGFWLKGSFYTTLRCLIFATIIFRCDLLLLMAPIGLELLLSRSVSLWKAARTCFETTLFCVGLTVLVDSVMWRRTLWPELEVFWFNSVLNRSSEWGTHPFYWYFTSALPRSLLAAYPLVLVGTLLERRVARYVIPVLSFVLLYSKLPHKELRFIISSIPIFNLSAATAASRIYNNRKKGFWRFLYVALLGLFLISLGCTIITFLASYGNYPSGYALKALHSTGHLENKSAEVRVHIDTLSAMNGISRFCEIDSAWRYSKEEGISMEQFQKRNFTYLLNEHSNISGFRCLFAVDGFSRFKLRNEFPHILLLKEPKVFVHGSVLNSEVMQRKWPGC